MTDCVRATVKPPTCFGCGRDFQEGNTIFFGWDDLRRCSLCHSRYMNSAQHVPNFRRREPLIYHAPNWWQRFMKRVCVFFEDIFTIPEVPG